MAKKVKTQAASFDMSGLAESVAMTDSNILASMIDELIESADDADDDVLDPLAKTAAEFAPDEIAAAVSDIARAESVQALYVAQDESRNEIAPSEADVPSVESAKLPEGKKAGKKTAAKKTESAQASTPKLPKASRLTYVTSSKSAVLSAKLGEKAADYLVLEVGDISLGATEMQAKMNEVLGAIDACPQKKVQEKAVMLFGWMAKGGALNEVMARAFKVLLRDGKITTGEKGNLMTELLAKPYSVGTARAQSGQILSLFPMLKVTDRSKGVLTANEQSLVLMKAAAELKAAD